MSFTRRKFVLGMGTVIFFTGSASSLLANTRQEKEVRYAMIHDESRCNGCNICARACRKTNHVPAQGSRLSIAHIPVTDNDNETQYHFFRQSCQHCEDAPCIDVCPTGASWRDEQGIVRVEKSQCIGCVIALALVRTRFATLTLSLKWQINVISALSPDWQKAFRPFASAPVRNTH